MVFRNLAISAEENIDWLTIPADMWERLLFANTSAPELLLEGCWLQQQTAQATEPKRQWRGLRQWLAMIALSGND